MYCWFEAAADISVAPFPHHSASQKKHFTNDMTDHHMRDHEWNYHGASKVLMCQVMKRDWGLPSYWVEPKLSLDLCVPLYDMGTCWDFLNLTTFLSFVPKSGKLISMLSFAGTKAHHACSLI